MVTPCSVLQPCQNNGTCINVLNNSYGYFCSCVNGFDGVLCQNDRRICRMNRCLHNGKLFHFSFVFSSIDRFSS